MTTSTRKSLRRRSRRASVAGSDAASQVLLGGPSRPARLRQAAADRLLRRAHRRLDHLLVCDRPAGHGVETDGAHGIHDDRSRSRCAARSSTTANRAQAASPMSIGRSFRCSTSIATSIITSSRHYRGICSNTGRRRRSTGATTTRTGSARTSSAELVLMEPMKRPDT